jgi:hypothetical protein
MPMLLVPKELRRAGMTGDVPYYGGRLSPAQAYAASHPRPAPAPRPAPVPVERPVEGPVQVLVVELERPAFSGEVLRELWRLRQAGVVRLVDLLLVRRTADGTFERLPAAPDGVGAGLGGLAAAVLGRPADEPAGDAGKAAQDVGEALWSLADVVPPGRSAAVALIEHTWAGPLVATMRRAGGAPLDETWLAPGDLAALHELAGREPGRTEGTR